MMKISTVRSPLAALGGDLIDLVLNQLSIRDWLRVGATSRIFHSFVELLKRATVDAIGDGSIYTKKQLYKQCLRNKTLSTLFQWDKSEDREEELSRLRSAIKSGRNVVCFDDRLHDFVLGVSKIRVLQMLDAAEAKTIVQMILASTYCDPATDNQNLVQLAVIAGMTDLLRSFLTNPSTEITDKYIIQRLCSCNIDLECLDLLLLDKRFDPAFNDNCAINNAAEFGHLDIVRRLLVDPRVDPSDDENAAIKAASEEGHVEIVRLLLGDSRVNPSAGDNYCLVVAAHKGQYKVIELLLADQRTEVALAGSDALHEALMNGHVRVADLLLGDDRINLTIEQRAAIILQAKVQVFRKSVPQCFARGTFW